MFSLTRVTAQKSAVIVAMQRYKRDSNLVCIWLQCCTCTVMRVCVSNFFLCLKRTRPIRRSPKEKQSQLTNAKLVKTTSNMASVLVADNPSPGFSFENCRRNAFLVQQGHPLPKATKTGTTIVGIIYKDGVILGADTRATEDTIVADKNCSKIHYLAKNIYCCGAGTAADTEVTTRMISSQLELHRLSTARDVAPVVTANKFLKHMLFRYQGHIGAALVLGGVDSTGPHLYSIYPHGSSDKLPYTTMGSGSLAAMAVFEAGWKPDMTEEEGKKLVRDAIAAGIFNDLGSGSNVDVCVIRRGSVDYLRPYDQANVKGQKQLSYRYKKGTTAVLSTNVIPIEIEETSVRSTTEASGSAVESMDTSS